MLFDFDAVVAGLIDDMRDIDWSYVNVFATQAGFRTEFFQAKPWWK